jgi:hypothetical protein
MEWSGWSQFWGCFLLGFVATGLQTQNAAQARLTDAAPTSKSLLSSF